MLRKFGALLRVTWSDALAFALSDKPLRLAMTAPIWAIALLIEPAAALRPEPLSLAALPFAIVLAFLIYFFNQCCIGLLSFWWTQVLAVQDFWFGLYAFASGCLVPLDLLPAPVTRLLSLLPFRAMLGFPVELLLGRLGLEAIGVSLLLQLGWCLALFGLMLRMWRRSLRRYSAVGA